MKIWKNGLLIVEGPNLVVTTGLNHIAQRLGSSVTAMSHLAVGDNGASSELNMSALLGTELERVALSSTTVANNTVAYSATVGAGFSLTRTIREAGIFNDGVAGDMLCRFICSGFDLSPGEFALVEWAVTMGS